MMNLLCYNIAIFSISVIRKSLLPLHDFIVMPLIYTCLAYVVVFEPWYLAVLFCAGAWKIDTHVIPCPMYEWHKSLYNLEIKTKIKKRQYKRGF